MRTGEFTGHSIDEAVFHGLQEMGLSIDEVIIETLQTESKGIFGIGAKLARVRLIERDLEEAPATKPVYNTRDEDREKQGSREYAPREPRNHNKREERARQPHGGKSDRRDERAQQEYREERQRPRYAYSEELAAQNEAALFLKALLDKMKISARVLAAEEDEGIRLRIDSETRGLLIGRRGETLDALQYITALHVNRNRKQEKYLRITIDTEDYRGKREDTLIRLARRQAARVKASGRPVSMEPMNPYERRVLHSALQSNPYVTTYSEGEEMNRHVVIAPKR